jgi:hypothetical protein
MTSNLKRRLKKPVAWLLGRDLIASLQGTLLYTAFGSKLDPRQWMRAEPIRFKATKEEKEFWFDYIADSGDGMKATYSIAYLSLSNLYINELIKEMPSDKNAPEVSQEMKAGFAQPLPRGRFLLVGGDTSYHLSDYATLGSRFYQPFKWAFEDLWAKLKKDGRSAELESLKFRRPIFGIPGNHDYYDQLDGFRRQFLRPTKAEPEGDYEANMPAEDNTTVPQLMIPGFRRIQDSSYVGLELPFGWWLWGLDTEVGLIDEHQQNFFQDIKRRLFEEALEEWNNLPEAEKEKIQPPNPDDFPQKLIMATCSPTTSFGRFAREDDKKSAESFAQLKLSQPFMPNEGEGSLSARSGDAKLNGGQCRLDLSGDYHFYARYWGPASAQAPPRESNVERPTAESYASVISGLGGAFHHPSQTFFGDLQEQVLYPSENTSRGFFSKRLFNFTSIFRGGGIGILGFCLAFAIYFTATVPPSSRQILQNALAAFSLTNTTVIEPTVLPIERDRQSSRLFSRDFNLNEARYYVGEKSLIRPWNYVLIIGFLIGSLIIIAASAIFFPKSGKQSKLKKRKGEKEIAVEKDPATVSEEDHLEQKNIPVKFDLVQKLFGSLRQVFFGSLVLISSALLFTGLVTIIPYRGNVTPFGLSMLVLLTLIWSASSAVLSFRYSEWLFKQASIREIGARDWLLPWGCAALSVVSIAAGIWLFGKFTVPAYLVTDIIFVLASVGVGILIILLAYFVGGADFSWKGRTAMMFVGIWHALLQLTVPFLLVSKGSAMTFAAAALLVVLFGLVGWQLMKYNQRTILLIVWLVFGALMIALPYLTFDSGHDHDFASCLGVIGDWQANLRKDAAVPPPPVFSFSQATAASLALLFKSLLSSFITIVPSLIAGVIGLIMSCIWLGWYLAVSLSFNAHNNEAGGAGRIEEFKEFVRFRLTENEITGYVIAVNKPEEDGSRLEPKLIDVFSLKTKGN